MVAVLLCVLWVRSVGRWERIYFGFTKSVGLNLQSGNGQVKLVWTDWSDEPSVSLVRCIYSEARDICPSPENWRFHFYNHDKNQTHFGAPNWSLLIVSVIISATPWIHFRFSLRTLLIVTALVAVVIGLVVWLG